MELYLETSQIPHLICCYLFFLEFIFFAKSAPFIFFFLFLLGNVEHF